MRPGRFDVEIYVQVPDYDGRREILDLYLARILTRDVNTDLLARNTIGFTGADIENMVQIIFILLLEAKIDKEVKIQFCD